jgi:type I restriction enzyme S subunit
MVDAKRVTNTRLLPYLRNVDVQWDRINTEGLPRIDIAEQEHERFTVRSGDLLVCEGRHLGRAAIWRDELPVCAFQKALHRLRARDAKSDVPRYLYYCLYVVHFQDAFGASSSDNSIPHLTGEMLRAFKFPFPPLSEQIAIATHLDAYCSALNRARAAIDREIRAIREYRVRLIADAVTGKLDVRDAAARLPVEPHDQDSLDKTEVFADTEGEVDESEVDADAEPAPALDE